MSNEELNKLSTEGADFLSQDLPIQETNEFGVIDFLSEEQRKAKAFIESHLDIHPTDPKIIILAGLTGVGKTHVLNSISHEIEEKDCFVADADKTIRNENSLHWRTPRGPIIILSTINNLERFKNTFSENYRIIEYVMRGMDLVEAEEFFLRLLSEKTTKIPVKRLAQLSLGVPSLAKLLVWDPNLTETAAIQICKDYLRRVSDEDVKKGLQFSPPQEVIEALQKPEDDNLYKDIAGLQDKRKEIFENYGILEESAEFIDPQSLEIYNQLLSLSSKKASSNRLAIFIPELSEKDFQRIGEALGFLIKGNIISDEMFNYYGLQGIRNKMFHAEFRKTGVWFRTSQGKDYCFETECDYLQNHAEALLRRFQNGKFPLKPSQKTKKACVFDFKRDHNYDTTFHVIRHGWMMESLLQQRNIPYLVIYSLIDQIYIYDPLEKKIKRFEGETDILKPNFYLHPDP